MVLVKYKYPTSIKIKSHVPTFDYTFTSTPIEVPAEHAEKILANPDFVKVGDEEYYTKEDLEKLKIQDLRKIGLKYGAKDTSKDELIAEILKAQKR